MRFLVDAEQLQTARFDWSGLQKNFEGSCKGETVLHAGRTLATARCGISKPFCTIQTFDLARSTSHCPEPTVKAPKQPRRPNSSIRNQPPRNHIRPILLIQHIKIHIHKLILRHKIRDSPNRGAPLRPRDRIRHLARIQDQTHGGGMALQ